MTSYYPTQSVVSDGMNYVMNNSPWFWFYAICAGNLTRQFNMGKYGDL